jgi:hypothetical protein
LSTKTCKKGKRTLSEYFMEMVAEKAEERINLEILEQLALLHFSDKRIMRILKIDIEQLKYLREMLQKRPAAMADD